MGTYEKTNTDEFKTVHFISESEEALLVLQKVLHNFMETQEQPQINELYNKWFDDINPATPLAPAMQQGVFAASSTQHANALGKKRKSKKRKSRKRKSRKFKKSRKPKSHTRKR